MIDLTRDGKRNLVMLSCAAILLAIALGSSAQDGRSWKPLAADGVHDPAGEGLKDLQEPAAALSKLPAGTGGDRVKWGAALEQKLIAPRPSTDPKSVASEDDILDEDILMSLYGSLLPVRFPHKDHTQWLACENCHDKLFEMEQGASGISMMLILEGKQCGVCHGAVAFPLTECKRCHNVPRSEIPVATKKRK